MNSQDEQINEIRINTTIQNILHGAYVRGAKGISFKKTSDIGKYI